MEPGLGTRSGRPTIGVLTPSLVELYQVQWLGAVDAASALGVNLISFVGRELDSPLGFDARANAIYELVGPERLDGLVLWSTALGVHAAPGSVQELRGRHAGLPAMSVEEVIAGTPSLLMDERRGMREAVAHLAQTHGCERIAYVRGPHGHRGAQERYLGYLDALADSGLAHNPALVSPPPPSWDSDVPSQWLESVLDSGVRLDAVAATNDSLAAAVLATLGARRLRTPDDVAVIGFDDVAGLYGLVDPDRVGADFGREDRGATGDALDRAVSLNANAVPLTTVRAPFYALGYRAVEGVMAQLRGMAVPAIERVPTELIVRHSCGCRAAAIDLTPPPTQAHEPGAVVDPAAVSRLVPAFADEVSGAGYGFHLHFDDVLRAGVHDGVPVETWRPILAALRDLPLPAPSSEVVGRREVVLLRAERLLDEWAGRVSTYRRKVEQKRNQIVRRAAQRLTTCLDTAELAEVLASELSDLGIPGCHLAAYTEDGFATSILAYEGGLRRDVAAEDASFACRELLPRGLLADRSYAFVALPLFFHRQRLGFVLFEVGPRVGWIYEALQDTLASAMEVAFLVDRERRAVEAAEVARDRSERAEAAVRAARDDLERRVTERTAELARANDSLAAQLIEREQADAVRAELEARLRQVEKVEAIGRLAGGIAHDFNNLLVVINGYSDLLIENPGIGREIRDDLVEIFRAGQRAQSLTQQLLAFSRQQVLKPTVVQVNEVVRGVETMLNRLIGEDVVLETRLPTTLWPVYADAGQLEQVIVNLVLNARDAMPRGGRVLIETRTTAILRGTTANDLPEGSYVVLSVTDSGSGMDAQTRERVFEPFFTTKSTGKGTGLGLATVFGIARQSGGTVVVDSLPGRGSTFSLYLPRSERDIVTTDPVPEATAPRGVETILLVEDDDRVRRAAHRFLEERGYRVHDAPHGWSALRVAEECGRSIDLVITDVVMPEMTGPELVERLSVIVPGVSTLFMSGYTESPALRGKLEQSDVSLVAKPFTGKELAARVREVLDRRG